MYTVTDIEDIAGQYNGERIFVIGNGPSLNKTPLESLESEYTLAMNGISSIYSERDWLPHFYYYALPPDHKGTQEHNITRNIDLGVQCLLNSGWKEVIGEKKNVFYFDRWSLHNNNPFANAEIDQIEGVPVEYLYEFWSDSPQYFVYHYHSMYSALQTIIALGFDEIYFIGCDLGFSYTNPHMIFNSGMDPYRYEGDKYDYLTKSISELNLFRSIINGISMKILLYWEKVGPGKIFKNPIGDNYFTKDYITKTIHDGEKAQEEQIKAHTAIRRICEDKNVDVYNATRGGELEVYERVDIFDVV